jgi:hypothetical protein
MPLLSTIVGGSLFAYAPSGNDFAFETNEFSAQFSLGQTSGIHLPLAPQIGTSIDCSAVLAGRQALHVGYGDFAGQSFQKLWFDGVLEFKAGNVMVPALPATPIRLIAPFKIFGNLIAYPSDPSASPPPAPSFQYKIAGAGNVTVRLTSPAGLVRNVTSYFYQFT